MVNDAVKTGLSFGLTSGIITTLGLMVGLHSGTHSKVVVIGGILTIAIADAFSDALGIHVAQESQNRHSTRAIWESTLATFVAKFIVAVTFVIPIVLLPMGSAMVASALWGLLLLAGFSFYMASAQGVSPWGVVAEHVLIALLVIVITHYLGEWLGEMFGAGSQASHAYRIGYAT